jgi:hypothetical protein
MPQAEPHPEPQAEPQAEPHPEPHAEPQAEPHPKPQQIHRGELSSQLISGLCVWHWEDATKHSFQVLIF